MADWNEIDELLTPSPSSPMKKYTHKRYVTVHPTSDTYQNNQLTTFNLKNIQNQLISYQNAFLLVNFTITSGTADHSRINSLANFHASLKGPHSFIKSYTVRMNNQEIENVSNYSFLINEMQTQFETPQDFSRLLKQYCYVQDNANPTTHNTGGASTRKSLINSTPANNQVKGQIKIPLNMISQFFRALPFPIINQLFEIEISFRDSEILFSDHDDYSLTINTARLVLPIVELRYHENKKFLEMINKGSAGVRKFKWNKPIIRVTPTLTANNEFSSELEASIDGIRKIYLFPRTNTTFDDTHLDHLSTIKLDSLNWVIDSEDFYSEDLKTDEMLYEVTSECFNTMGRDPNSGSIFDYQIFKNVSSFYGFDLSRQKVFEGNPRKAQSIRLRCKPGAQCVIFYVILYERETVIDFTNPLNSKTN